MSASATKATAGLEKLTKISRQGHAVIDAKGTAVNTVQPQLYHLEDTTVSHQMLVLRGHRLC